MREKALKHGLKTGFGCKSEACFFSAWTAQIIMVKINKIENENIVKVTKMTYKSSKINKFIDNKICICYNQTKKWDQSQLKPEGTALF